jgi:hypothetical protein
MEILKSILLFLLFASGLILVLIIIYTIARLVALAFVKTLKDQLMIGKDKEDGKR